MKKILIFFSAVSIVLIILSGGSLYYFISKYKEGVPKMFQQNRERISEGYYMAEFEFEMVGILYLFDRGYYLRSFKLLKPCTVNWIQKSG